MRLPQRIIESIREQMPSTHEIGGHLLLGGGGDVIEKFRVYKGKPCRNEKGERFRNTHCKIRKPDHALSFHTHPKSNRPSSSDLRNAVLKHPEMGRRGRRRLKHLCQLLDQGRPGRLRLAEPLVHKNTQSRRNLHLYLYIDDSAPELLLNTLFLLCRF